MAFDNHKKRTRMPQQIQDTDTTALLTMLKGLFQSGSQGFQIVEELQFREVKSGDIEDVTVNNERVSLGGIRPRRRPVV